MKIVRFLHEGVERFGVIEGTDVRLAKGTPFGDFELTDARLPYSSLKLLSPCKPGKALCIGLNYRDHALEFGFPIPEKPVVFIKPSTCVIAPLEAIERPAVSKRVDFEAELVVVIGKKAKNVRADEARDYILGYTCGNDVTARDLQPKDGQWTVSKSFDTFLPFGPWVETELDTSALGVRAYLNGEVKQSSITSNLIFAVPELVEFLSSVMTLEPGDIIMTGTPSGVGPMKSGDEIVIEIDGIGRLVNPVR
ncbi:MAG: fumarylacetoacetate hydrolase family protein [Rectinemataceae bacterium]|nr:fumarylacetoacetate hydrolase family protein [Rectinemataceae bacterium]